MGQAALDPKELLERLQAEHQVLQWAPLPPDEPPASRSNQGPSDRSSLDYLHHHWALADSSTPPASEHGLRGRATTLFGRLVFRVLGPYLHQEQEFRSRAVQVIDALDRRCSELAQQCQELSDSITDRQVAEAENQAKLALWLHLAPPTTSTADVAPSGQGDGSSTR